MGKVNIGFMTVPHGERGKTDEENAKARLEEIEYNFGLGYETVWSMEHHAGDYAPTPSPLQIFAHTAALYPEAGLGTCILVTPLYYPARLIEEISTLATLSRGELHMGLGRGMAQIEFDAFSVDLNETRGRFDETADILRLAFTQGSFTYPDGKYYCITREAQFRPILSEETRQRIHFYGVLGSSPARVARLGLGPIITATGSMEATVSKFNEWVETAKEVGLPTDGPHPLVAHCIIEDTDEEAYEAARKWITIFRQLQVEHYKFGTQDFSQIKGYEGFGRVDSVAETARDPEKVTDWAQVQVVGSPETAAKHMRQYIDAGFTHFAFYCNTPYVPRELSHRWYTRLATEVMPLVKADLAKNKTAGAVSSS